MGKFDFHVLSYGLHKLPFHWSIKKNMILAEQFKITTLLDMQATDLLTYSMQQSLS